MNGTTTGEAHAPAAPSRVIRSNRRVNRTVGLAIGAGAGLQGVTIAAFLLQRTSPQRALALSLAVSTFQYAAVGSLILWRLYPSGVRPAWIAGTPLRAVLTGGLVGLGGAGVLTALISLLSRRLASDSRVVLALYEAPAWRYPVSLMLLVLAAPAVEEILFRGFLAESLRPKGRMSAVLASGLAFAAWHLNPVALQYYLLIGFILGLLYWRFGLAGSMAAHATFNGALLVVAIVVVHGAGGDAALGASCHRLDGILAERRPVAGLPAGAVDLGGVLLGDVGPQWRRVEDLAFGPELIESVGLDRDVVTELRRNGFLRGHRRTWAGSGGARIVTFVYEFPDAGRAFAYDRAAARILCFSAPDAFRVGGVPGSAGVEGRVEGRTDRRAQVSFVRGPRRYLVAALGPGARKRVEQLAVAAAAIGR